MIILIISVVLLVLSAISFIGSLVYEILFDPWGNRWLDISMASMLVFGTMSVIISAILYLIRVLR